MAEFSTGVTTLLARMDTNPSEFFDGTYKWSFLNAEWVKTILTEAEETALNNKLTEVRRIAFDRMVMQTLLEDEAQESRLGPLMNSVYANVVNQQQLQNQYANPALNIYPGSWVETK